MKKFHPSFYSKVVSICLFSFLCHTRISASTNISGNQSGTWDLAGSPYIITATVTVGPGQTLIINPGVTVQFETGSIQLKVQGTLKAIGSSSDSIHFVRNGNFAGNNQIVPISFESASTNSNLQYVEIDGLGYYYYNDLTFTIYIASSSCEISNCTMENIQGTPIGIDENARPVIHNNSIRNNPNLDIVLHPDELKNIFDNDSLNVGLVNNIVPIASTDTLKAENRFYRLLTTVTIPLGKKFTINPAAEVQFNTGAVQLNVQGTLKAVGLNGNFIRLLRKGNLAGNNQIPPISFETASQNSVLQYVIIDGLGYYYANDFTAAIVIRSGSCKIDSCIIQNIQGTAILIGKGAKPVISNNTIHGSTLDVVLDPDKLINLSKNNALNIGLTDSIPMALNDILTSDNLLYRLLNVLTIPQTKILTINPDVKVEFPTGSIQLIVQGTLKALGIADHYIQFIKTGSFQGNNQVTPIIFDNNSLNSFLQFLSVDGLGYYYNNGTTPIIVVKSSSCQFVNSIFQNNKGVAIEIQNSASPSFYQSCFYNNLSGAVLSITGRSKFQNCNFTGNTSGIVNQTIADTVTAVNCYWGDPSGPFQRTTNPTGVGDSVSDRVLYRSYAVEAFDCSEFYNGPLPLTLLNFQVYLDGSNVNCSWQTASEINISRFTIERSINAIDFYDIGKINSAGNSGISKSYQFIDQTPNNGHNYYRLKIADKDGSYTYSRVVPINIAGNTSFSIYPIPVRNDLFIQLKRDQAEKIILQVTDIQGKILHEETHQLQTGTSAFSFNTSFLAKGTYILLIKGKKAEAKTFIKE